MLPPDKKQVSVAITMVFIPSPIRGTPEDYWHLTPGDHMAIKEGGGRLVFVCMCKYPAEGTSDLCLEGHRAGRVAGPALETDRCRLEIQLHHLLGLQ